MESTTNYESLAVELILFFKKWGMWVDTEIFTNGKMFAASYNKEDSYNGITNVIYKENLSGSEHIIEVFFDGPFYRLIYYREYGVCREDIEKEAWEYIFANTSIFDDFLSNYREFELGDVLFYFETVKALRFGEFGEDERENCPISSWDPLVFDTWEEYLEMGGDEESSPSHEFYDAWSEYLGGAENFGVIDIDTVKFAWEERVEEAKLDFLANMYMYDNETDLYLPKISGYIWEEFCALFDKYNLRYSFDSENLLYGIKK